MKRNMKHILLLSVFGWLMNGAIAQDQTALRKKQFNLDDGVAISGYDPVAYFTQNKAVKGSKENAVAYEGIVYYFSSVANKEEFKKNPAKYEPQYGGWCSYAMGAKGEKVTIDPKTFKIVDGKLNLFYNRLFNNTLTDWNKDEPHLKKNADANWAKTFH
jgi:YHS domain-containing protein